MRALMLSIAMILAFNASGEDECTKRVVCATSAANPRNGEGDIVALKDGRLLLAYSHWTKGAASDDSPAEICGRYSSDGGATWSAESTLIPNDAMNLMSVSLLRLHNGELMLVYGRRRSNADLRFYARFSKDEAKTWTADHEVTPGCAYHVVNNARIIQLKSGRLLAPAALCRGETWKKDYYFFNVVYYSDDNGRTWKGGKQKLNVESSSYGADEPGVIELKDGRVMMLIRTDTGRIWRSYSSDHGETWSPPEKTSLATPSSPSTIRRIPSTGDLLLVWNNASPSAKNKGEPRNPLTTALSRDEGRTWEHFRNLEDSLGGDYCYTSVTFVCDKAVMSYYERGAMKEAIVAVERFYR